MNPNIWQTNKSPPCSPTPPASLPTITTHEKTLIRQDSFKLIGHIFINGWRRRDSLWFGSWRQQGMWPLFLLVVSVVRVKHSPLDFCDSAKSFADEVLPTWACERVLPYMFPRYWPPRPRWRDKHLEPSESHSPSRPLIPRGHTGFLSTHTHTLNLDSCFVTFATYTRSSLECCSNLDESHCD